MQFLWVKFIAAPLVTMTDRDICVVVRYELISDMAFQAWSQGGSTRDVFGPVTLLDMAVAPALISGT